MIMSRTTPQHTNINNGCKNCQDEKFGTLCDNQPFLNVSRLLFLKQYIPERNIQATVYGRKKAGCL